jgi:hypothetical protein
MHSILILGIPEVKTMNIYCYEGNEERVTSKKTSATVVDKLEALSMKFNQSEGKASRTKTPESTVQRSQPLSLAGYWLLEKIS